MGASSTEGTGHGVANKRTTEQLAILSNGPSIMFTGIAEAESVATSPPAITNTVVFPYPLPENADHYVVMLTSINAGYVYVSDIDEVSGQFTGFSFVAEAEGSVMYLVAEVGSRPNL